MSYQKTATEARRKVLELIFKAQTSHIGSNFSCLDLLTVLFDKVDIKKDEVILSAGWKAAAWYYFLWKKGVISEEELDSFCREGSKFIGLTEPMNRWGLRFAGGSMGMGLPAAVGFALAKKIKGEEGTIYCLMSDGEMQIGTTWEASLIARQHNLKNLVVLVDVNGLQAMGETKDILDIPFLEYVDGHNFDAIEKDMSKENRESPATILFKTIKGKGVSFMENNNLYHYKAPSKEEYEMALKEL